MFLSQLHGWNDAVSANFMMYVFMHIMSIDSWHVVHRVVYVIVCIYNLDDPCMKETWWAFRIKWNVDVFDIHEEC